jgi:phosphoribosylamine-glycine ligase
MSYGPLDRGFILRFQNDGTGERFINFTSNDNRKADKWNKHPNTGGRGAIAPRNFFRGTGTRALAQAADTLANLINTELANTLNTKK